MASLPIHAGDSELIGEQLENQFSREQLRRRSTPEPRTTNGYHNPGDIALAGSGIHLLTEPHRQALSSRELLRVTSAEDGQISYEFPSLILTIPLPDK